MTVALARWRSFAPMALTALLAVSAFTVTGCGRAVDPGEWPRFRGAAGDGVNDDAGAPRRWRKNSKNVRWKTKVPGVGNSSPIVGHGRVYLTSVYGEPGDGKEMLKNRELLKRVAMAFDLDRCHVAVKFNLAEKGQFEIVAR